MEGSLKYFINGREPQPFCKRKTFSISCKGKTTSNYLSMEDNLNLLGIWRTTSNLEITRISDFCFFLNGRQPKFFGTWKTTSIIYYTKDNLSYFKI